LILIDANLLLYAYHPASAHHQRSRTWLEKVLSGGEPVRLAWATVLAFIRISTSPRVFEAPLTVDEAAAVVSAWFTRPCVAILEPGERHWEVLRSLLSAGQVLGPLVMDAHLAALALEHGATLHTNDRDFARFPGLRVSSPLVEAR
jgi:hypothetical protein